MKSNARLFLIPAHRAPRCVVVRRKPRKLWHVMLWHTDTDQIEHGSWFRGTLYPDRMDVSWDGRYMVYFALGSDASEEWSGICELPKLKTIVHWTTSGTYGGGGFFDGPDHVQLYSYDLKSSPLPKKAPVVPFTASIFKPANSELGYGVLQARLLRDGWQNVVPYDGSPWDFSKEDHLAWRNRPSRDHPEVRGWYRGYGRRTGDHYDFELEGHPGWLDDAQWATWNHEGQLLVARLGWIERFTLDDLSSKDPAPSFSLDLNELQPPWEV